ncbi:triose-phosphate isomerase, partial [bacterium]|nr:triose-phosphate isomerase [bacterium]
MTDYFKEIENFCDENKINNKKNIFFLTSLHILLAIQKFPVINFGNQSGSHLGMGAYTSTVSIEQLYQDGIKNILLGHSEENKYLGLNEKTTNLKLKKSLSFNFNVFLCFGNEQKENDYYKLAEKLANKICKLVKKKMF